MTYTEPLILLFCLAALIGLARVWRCNRKGLLVVAIVGLISCGWHPVEGLLPRPSEARYPVRLFRPTPGLQALVVFAPGVSPPLYERPYPQADYDTVERCGYAAWVYRQIGPVPV